MSCEKHGLDHLSRDPNGEFCKKTRGLMYQHLKNQYVSLIADHAPTLSFDFSRPLPGQIPLRGCNSDVLWARNYMCICKLRCSDSAVKQRGRERKGPPEIIQTFRLRNWPISSAAFPVTPMEGTDTVFGPF